MAIIRQVVKQVVEGERIAHPIIFSGDVGAILLEQSGYLLQEQGFNWLILVEDNNG